MKITDRSNKPEPIADTLADLRGSIVDLERDAREAPRDEPPLTVDEARAIALARARREALAWRYASGMPERYRRAELDDELVPAELRAWAQCLPSGRHRGSGILYGRPGSGKTASACWAIRRVLAAPEWTLEAPRSITVHMPQVAFVRCSDLFALIFSREDAAGERLFALRRLDYLVIDDLGMVHETDFPLGQLDALIDARWGNGLPTLVTTNLYAHSRDGENSVDERYPRLFSRLCDGIGTMRFPNRDLRLKDYQ